MTNHTSQSRTAKPVAQLSPAAAAFEFPGGPIGVLLVHGFAGSIADLRPLAEHLQAGGYSIVGLRLPGHGRSVDDLHASRVDDWLAEVRRGLALFPKNVTKIVMVGESMGGLLSLLTREHDTRVRGIVLLAPPFRVAHERWREFLSRMLPSRSRRKKPWLTAADHAEHIAKGSLVELTVGSYRQFLQVMRAARKSLGSLNLPLLAVFSKSDNQTNIDSARVLREMTSGRVSILEVDGGRHHLMTGPSRDQIQAAIDAFITQLN